MSGIDRFMTGLRALGIECEQRGNLVVATLEDSPLGLPGPHEVGADPPGDFPNIPPHWVHLRTELVLPNGGPRASELGESWRKWSRQHPRWKPGYGSREWVAHVRSLLLTASGA